MSGLPTPTRGADLSFCHMSCLKVSGLKSSGSQSSYSGVRSGLDMVVCQGDCGVDVVVVTKRWAVSHDRVKWRKEGGPDLGSDNKILCKE
jgi:hypothetical protein